MRATPARSNQEIDNMDTAALFAVIAFVATCASIAYTIAFIVDRIVNR